MHGQQAAKSCPGQVYIVVKSSHVHVTHPLLVCYSSACISTISSFAPRKTPLHQQRCSQRVMAYEREWPNSEFIKEVDEAFPDQGIANVEEARVGLLPSRVRQL